MLDIKEAKLKTSFLGAFTGLFGGGKDQPKLDKNQLDIKLFKRVGKEKLIFEIGKGNYARHLELGGRVYYPVPGIDFPTWELEAKTKTTLPSSAILRKDILLLKADNLTGAKLFV